MAQLESQAKGGFRSKDYFKKNRQKIAENTARVTIAIALWGILTT